MKSKKRYILFFLFFLALGVTIYVLLGRVPTTPVNLNEDARPTYLSASIPSLEKLEIILNNPRFQEMEYSSAFFQKITIDQTGRVNPFMPFVDQDED
ncbi:hypothetical protein K9K85_02180 [Patescibacteria group bacterium]|nr:hypothetical protein [Patescibacteria group bacterium]